MEFSVGHNRSIGRTAYNKQYKLNPEKIESIDDIKKVLSMMNLTWSLTTDISTIKHLVEVVDKKSRLPNLCKYHFEVAHGYHEKPPPPPVMTEQASLIN